MQKPHRYYYSSRRKIPVFFATLGLFEAGFLSRVPGRPTDHAARMAVLQETHPFFPATQGVPSGFVAWINRILGREGSSARLKGLPDSDSPYRIQSRQDDKQSPGFLAMAASTVWKS